MPIGKDSITKRVAKVDTTEENIAPELVATTAAAPKAPAKKAPAKKPATATKKPAAPKAAAPKAEPNVKEAVITSIAPETVEAVIGHKENTTFDKVKIGDELPIFLM